MVKQIIPKSLRISVWDKYIGEKIGKIKCLCCELSDITQLKFECGHIIAEANGRFVYTYKNKNYKLYCFNGKYWENDDIIFRKCVGIELYDFLKMILIEIYWNTKDFNTSKNKIEKLKTIAFKKDIVETYKEYGVDNDIRFDDKW